VTTILDRIVSTKREEIAAAKLRTPETELRAALQDAPPPRDFFAALAEPGGMKLIAEVKKASPSKGIIRANFDPVDVAKSYELGGAHCLSVLTDQQYFQGSHEYLKAIRGAVSLPLLRKDFILDIYQLLEARIWGADAVLLIAECLDDCTLRTLHNEALNLGLTPLVELYETQNIERVLATGATLIGVNNRDLRTFEVDLDHSIRLKRQIPDNCLLVAESGIAGRGDVLKLQEAGVDAILVGEHLMRQADISAAVGELLGIR
jgi:indole-3-glycerol phosphate synthase